MICKRFVRGVDTSEAVKDIKGFEDLYCVSVTGKVYKYPKREDENFELLIPLEERGYYYLYLKGYGTTYRKSIHRLVAEAWMYRANKKLVVNHINGLKHDNSMPNLEWTTPSLNTKHAHRTGLIKNISNLKDGDIKKIIELRMRGKTLQEIGDQFGLTRERIRQITKPYDHDEDGYLIVYSGY